MIKLNISLENDNGASADIDYCILLEDIKKIGLEKVLDKALIEIKWRILEGLTENWLFGKPIELQDIREEDI